MIVAFYLWRCLEGDLRCLSVVSVGHHSTVLLVFARASQTFIGALDYQITLHLSDSQKYRRLLTLSLEAQLQNEYLDPTQGQRLNKVPTFDAAAEQALVDTKRVSPLRICPCILPKSQRDEDERLISKRLTF